MSENDLCDTAMEQQPIIEACTACTSQHKPQGEMPHFHPLSPPRARVGHTHLRASPQRTAAQQSRSPQLSLTKKKALQMCSAFLVQPCLHGVPAGLVDDDSKKDGQPIIKACTACASEQKPPRETQHLIHTQRQEHASVTHISRSMTHNTHGALE